MLKDYYVGAFAKSTAGSSKSTSAYSKTDKHVGSSSSNNKDNFNWVYVIVPVALVAAFLIYKYI
jgi:hypothetical protein